MIIDSHCHLNYSPMSENLDEVIKRAKNNGVNYMLTISTEHKSFENVLSIIDNYKEVYGTYGIHPHEAKNHMGIKKDNIINSTKLNKKIIGIGETGLDFHYNHSEKKDQCELFEQHIYASQSTGLPLIIHSRNAEKETLEILEKNLKKKEFKFLIHCFTGSYEFSKKLIDLNAYISASGVITFKKSSEIAETFKKIPNNKILIETDSPYLAPEPKRGKSNEPSFIVFTLSFISKIKDLPVNEFAKITSNNFFNLFGRLS
tara:strand:- start:108 stop:884 length:777 start_codon:yes stop_codon:yes gene_type:complete